MRFLFLLLSFQAAAQDIEAMARAAFQEAEKAHQALLEKNAPIFNQLVEFSMRDPHGTDVVWESDTEVCVIRVSDSQSITCQHIPISESKFIDTLD